MNRSLFGILVIGTLAGWLGCASIARIMPVLIGDDDQPTAEPCIAQYDQLTPVSRLGHDGCGNFWVERDGECWILADSVMVRLPKCPAEGDTLGK